MKSTQQYAKEILDKHNLTLISEYLGAHKPVEFLCNNNHKNSAIATNLLQRGYTCKECKVGRPIISKITWTKEMLEPFIGLKSTEEIALHYNTTVSAVNNALNNLGISNAFKYKTTNDLIDVLDIQERLITSEQEYYEAHDYVTTLCKYNHETTQLVSNVIYKGIGCPTCTSLSNTSAPQQELANFIKQISEYKVIEADRTIITPQELDIVIPELKLAIDFNNSNKKVPTNYHLNKTNVTESKGYQLIHIFESQYTEKKDIIHSRLNNLINPPKPIYARNCTVKEIPYPKAFLEENHIQSHAVSSINLGLFHNDELIQVMTFGKPRFDKHHDYELIRFCTKLNHRVQGGASKLFKHAPKGSILSYADRSWSTGKLYETLGFKLLHATGPNLFYADKTSTISRYRAQNMDTSKLHKIYGPGSLVYSTTR